MNTVRILETFLARSNLNTHTQSVRAAVRADPQIQLVCLYTSFGRQTARTALHSTPSTRSIS